jgi:hypothetical protein
MPSHRFQRPRLLRRRVITALTASAVATAVLAAASAPASALTAQQAVANVGARIVNLPSMTYVPPGFAIDGAQAVAIAKTSKIAIAVHSQQHPLQIIPRLWYPFRYEVYMFFHGRPVVDVELSHTGKILYTWTGPLIEATYGRGNYNPLFDTPWVCLSFAALFLLPFLSLRRRPTIRQLDVAVLLSFGVSYWLFNQRHFEAAVWMVYPPLVYLLARMLYIGFGRGRGRATANGARGPALDSWLPTRILAVGLLLLVAARVVLALTAATPVDVGVASVAGAYRLLHGFPIYYSALGHPDTYGPINYLAYVPFELIFPWSGKWDYLSAARVAAITFDVLTVGGLFWVGKRLRPGARGVRLGLIMGWLWAACPFTLLGLMRATNDGLVSVLIVGLLLTMTTPVARGVIVGLGAAAKFVPGLLLPLVAIGHRRDGRRARIVAAGCVIVTGASFALFMPPGGAGEVWNHTLGFQLSRPDLFSIWGLHHSLDPIKSMLSVCAVALAGALAAYPRGERSLVQISALIAAVLIASQIPAVHWFYFYILWFMPVVAVAIVAADTTTDHRQTETTTIGAADIAPVPVLVGGAP